jgi:hypothetical protein
MNENSNSNLENLKKQGNECMFKGKYFEAIKFYTEYLNKNDCNTNSFQNIIPVLSNRAEAFLKLGYFNSALNDCEAIFKIDPENPKAMNRKARALESLYFLKKENCQSSSNLNQAKEIYEKLLVKFSEQGIKIDLENKINKINRKFDNLKGEYKIEELLQEENEIFKFINSKDYKVNTHSKEYKFCDYFSSKLKIEFSNHKGIYYVANENIKQGELLLLEKPLVGIFSDEYEKFKYEILEDLNIEEEESDDENYILYNILSKNLIQRLEFENEKDYILNNLSTLYDGENGELNLNERSQKFLQNCSKNNINSLIKKIISANGVLSLRNTSGLDYKDICYGLWVKFDFFNHSCSPNAFYFGVGPYIIVKAIDDIPQGQEVTISYIEQKSYSERAVSLKKWNFTCQCEICQIENKISSDVNYLYINKKINKAKYYLSKNYLMSYSQIKSFFANGKNQNVLNKFSKWIEKVLSIFNSLTQDEIYSKYYMILFLFFKTYWIIFSYTDKKDYTHYLFDKCYEMIKLKSIRESYEIMSSYISLSENDIFKFKLLEIKSEIKKLNKILYEI